MHTYHCCREMHNSTKTYVLKVIKCRSRSPGNSACLFSMPMMDGWMDGWMDGHPGWTK